MSNLDSEDEDAGIWGVPIRKGIHNICTRIDQDKYYMALVAKFQEGMQPLPNLDQETQEVHNYRLPQVYGDSEDSDTSANIEDNLEFEVEFIPKDNRRCAFVEDALSRMNHLSITNQAPNTLYDQLYSVQNESIITKLQSNKSLKNASKILPSDISKNNKKSNNESNTRKRNRKKYNNKENIKECVKINSAATNKKGCKASKKEQLTENNKHEEGQVPCLRRSARLKAKAVLKENRNFDQHRNDDILKLSKPRYCSFQEYLSNSDYSAKKITSGTVMNEERVNTITLPVKTKSETQVQNNGTIVKTTNKVEKDTKVNQPLSFEEWDKVAYNQYVKNCNKDCKLHRNRLKKILNQEQCSENVSANKLNKEDVASLNQNTKAKPPLTNNQINQAYNEYEMKCINTESLHWKHYNIIKGQKPHLRILPANKVIDVKKIVTALRQENKSKKNIFNKFVNDIKNSTNASKPLSAASNSKNKDNLRITQTIFLCITEEKKVAPSVIVKSNTEIQTQNNRKKSKTTNTVKNDIKENELLTFTQWKKLAYEEYTKNCDKDINLHRIRLAQSLYQKQPVPIISANTLNKVQVVSVNKNAKVNSPLTNKQIKEAYSRYEKNCTKTKKLHLKQYNKTLNQRAHLRIFPANTLNYIQGVDKTTTAQLEENKQQQNTTSKVINHAINSTNVWKQLSAPDSSSINKDNLRMTQTIGLNISEDKKITTSVLVKSKSQSQAQNNGQEAKTTDNINHNINENKLMSYKQWEKLAYKEYVKNCKTDCNLHKIRLDEILKQEQHLPNISANMLDEGPVAPVNKDTNVNPLLTNKQIKQAYSDYEMNCTRTKKLHWKQYNIVRSQRPHLRILPANNLNDIQGINKTATTQLQENKLVINSTDSKQLSVPGSISTNKDNLRTIDLGISKERKTIAVDLAEKKSVVQLENNENKNETAHKTNEDNLLLKITDAKKNRLARRKREHERRKQRKKLLREKSLTHKEQLMNQEVCMTESSTSTQLQENKIKAHKTNEDNLLLKITDAKKNRLARRKREHERRKQRKKLLREKSLTHKEQLMNQEVCMTESSTSTQLQENKLQQSISDNEINYAKKSTDDQKFESTNPTDMWEDYWIDEDHQNYYYGGIRNQTIDPDIPESTSVSEFLTLLIKGVANIFNFVN